MGYRSDGFFAFPKKYLPELEKRMLEANITWMINVDAETGEKSIKLDGFDEITYFEDQNGFGEMMKVVYSGWKWYSGYDVPQIIEGFLHDMDAADMYDSPEEAREETFKDLQINYPIRFINYDSKQVAGMTVNTYEEPYAFVRVGEEHPDTEIATNMYDIYAQTYISNHPVSERPPITTIMLDVTSTEEAEVKMITEGFYKQFRDQIVALSSDEYYEIIDQQIRKYRPYSKQGEPPKPEQYNKNVFYGWHSDKFADGLGKLKLNQLVADMAKWVEREQKLSHTLPMVDRKVEGGDIQLAAFTFLEEGDPIHHDSLIEVDVELTSHWDLDIYLNNDFYSEI